MTGWQWHQLDHMRIICTLLQADNHAGTSSYKRQISTEIQFHMLVKNITAIFHTTLAPTGCKNVENLRSGNCKEVRGNVKKPGNHNQFLQAKNNHSQWVINRQYCAQSNTLVIQVTQRPILRFFAPKGRHVAPMGVKFDTEEGTKGFWICKKLSESDNIRIQTASHPYSIYNINR